MVPSGSAPAGRSGRARRTYGSGWLGHIDPSAGSPPARGLGRDSARGLMPRRRRPLYARSVTALFDRLQVARTDAVLATLLVVAGLVQAVLWPIAPGVVGELFVLGSTLPLAWRRHRPVEAALVASAFWLIPLDGYPVLGFVTVILQFFGLGAWGVPRLVVALTTLWACGCSVLGTLWGPESPVAAIGAVLVVVAPVLAGRLVRHLHTQNQALEQLAADLREERLRAEEAAVWAERGRIAQELHDVLGH